MHLPANPPASAAGPSLATFPGPMPVYRARCRSGALKQDPMQELAAEKLQSLHRALIGYRPQPPAPQGGWFARLLAATPPPPPARPKGLYLFGGVGRGKSMLMDLFFATSAVEARRRVHFHAFMQEVHDRLHRLRQEATVADPLPVLARRIAEGATLLCFDEFQVTDIADAMILGRLFEALFQAGVVVVATSNRAPDELYAGGLHRDRILPFIALLKDELDVLELDNGRDYRRAKLIGRRVYLAPAGPAASTALGRMFLELTDGAQPEPAALTVKGRTLAIPRQASRTAWFGFADLCAQPLGPADFLALAEAFDTLLVEGVPCLGPQRRDEAKRFVLLIDALYEAKVHLVLSAEAPPEALYPAGDGSFEFQRTVSRLIEMQSDDYLSGRRGAAAPAALAGPDVSR